MTTHAVPATMAAVRLGAPGLEGLTVEEIETPRARAGEALVEVHAAAITRDELEWPADRLPATPSFELSGVVMDVADDVKRVAAGDAVYALTPFDRDGVAAAYAAVPVSLLAPKPSRLDHVQSAAIPLPAGSADQGVRTTTPKSTGDWVRDLMARDAAQRTESRQLGLAGSRSACPLPPGAAENASAVSGGERRSGAVWCDQE